jgi:hypothetical protein
LTHDGTHPLSQFCARKAGKGIGTVRGGNQAGLAQVVLLLKVSDLGFIGSVDNTDGDREDRVALAYC